MKKSVESIIHDLYSIFSQRCIILLLTTNTFNRKNGVFGKVGTDVIFEKISEEKNLVHCENFVRKTS